MTYHNILIRDNYVTTSNVIFILTRHCKYQLISYFLEAARILQFLFCSSLMLCRHEGNYRWFLLCAYDVLERIMDMTVISEIDWLELSFVRETVD